MPEHDSGRRHACDNRGRDVVFGFLAVILPADVIRDSHPLERGQDDDQQPEGGLEDLHASRNVCRHDDGTDDDDGVEEGQRGPDFDKTLAEQVDLPREITEKSPNQYADPVSNREHQNGERQRDIEPVRQPDEYVASTIVRAEWMLTRRRMWRESRHIQD